MAVDGLDCAYSRQLVALENISFNVAAGEKVAIMGGRAAGKSTLILILANALKHRGGVRLLGIAPKRASRENIRYLRANVVALCNDGRRTALGKHLTTRIQREIRAVFRHDSDTASKVLKNWRVDKVWGREWETLSSGEQQRIQMAAVELLAPRLLLADNPVNHLDISGRARFRELLGNPELTALMATHDLELARAAASRAILLCDGRIASDGPSADILWNEPLLHAAGVL